MVHMLIMAHHLCNMSTLLLISHLMTLTSLTLYPTAKCRKIDRSSGNLFSRQIATMAKPALCILSGDSGQGLDHGFL